MIEEYNLEDDSTSQFRGGSLRIHPGGSKSELLPKSRENVSLEKDNPRINANCHWGQAFISPLASIPSKLSVNLWTAKPESKIEQAAPQAPLPKQKTIQSSVVIPEDPSSYFTFRDGVVENAVKECRDEFLDEDSEGPLLAYYLLTQINHWDTDKERLILLTPKTLVIAKYDFIALRRLGYKKLPLDLVEQLHIGDLVYPNGSLIPDRNMKGARLMWKQENPNNFGAKWNPFTDNVPFCTFTYHPLYFHKDCSVEPRKNIFDVDLFVDKLCDIFVAMQGKKGDDKDYCAIYRKNIILENYVGIGSLIHNRNALGFFKAIEGDKMYTYYYLLYVLQLFHYGNLGNRPPKKISDVEVWQTFLKEQNLPMNITSDKYYLAWEKLIDSPHSFGRNMKREEYIDE